MSREAASVRGPRQTAGPASAFEWTFSFGGGFEGTDGVSNDLFVMVYYPGP